MRLPRRFFLFFFFFLFVISPPLRGPHAPPVLPTGVPPLIPRAASISMSLAALSRAYETITSSPPRDLLRRMMSNVSSTYSYLRVLVRHAHLFVSQAKAFIGRTINPIHHVSHARAHLRLERNLPLHFFFRSATLSRYWEDRFSHLGRPHRFYPSFMNSHP